MKGRRDLDPLPIDPRNLVRAASKRNIWVYLASHFSPLASQLLPHLERLSSGPERSPRRVSVNKLIHH